MARLTLAALLAGCATQTPPVDPRAHGVPAEAHLAATEVHLFHSASAGASYSISVALPLPALSQAAAAVYVVGERGSFALVAETARLLAGAGEIPPLLVIGIEREGPVRANDHARLLAFVDSELTPFLATRYSVNPSDVTLVGDRDGARFALYALFRPKQTFAGYLIVGPEHTPTRENRSPRTRLFLATGGLDPHADQVEGLTQRLRAHDPAHLDMETVILHGETRLSAVPGALSRGLRFLFPVGAYDAQRATPVRPRLTDEHR